MSKYVSNPSVFASQNSPPHSGKAARNREVILAEGAKMSFEVQNVIPTVIAFLTAL